MGRKVTATKAVKYGPGAATVVGETYEIGKDLSKEEADSLPPGTLVAPEDFRGEAEARRLAEVGAGDLQKVSAIVEAASARMDALTAEAAEVLQRAQAARGETERLLGEIRELRAQAETPPAAGR